MAHRNQTEEIFETPDLPECDQHAAADEEHFESEHIERIHLDVAAACDKFGGRLLDAAAVDLSEWAGHKAHGGAPGYGSANYVLQVVGLDDGGKAAETPAQRLSRLREEMTQLEKQMQQLRDAQAKDEQAHELLDGVKAADIAALNSRLKELQIQQASGGDAAGTQAVQLQKLTASIEALKKRDGAGDAGKITYDMIACPGTAADANSAARLAELEGRLAKMEKLLGGDMDKLFKTSATGDGRVSTLSDVVDLLAVKASLLDASQLDAIGERAAALSHRMQALASKNPDAPEYADKVDELYELMKKWDALCGALPDLVERLRSLQLLHEHAMHVAQSVTYLDGQNQSLEKTVSDINKMLAEVKNSMADNLQTMQQNMTALDGRMKALGAK